MSESDENPGALPGALAVRGESSPAREGRRGRRRLAPSPLSGVPEDTTAPLTPALAAWPEPGEHVRMLLTMRADSKRRFLVKFGLFCGLPTVLMAIYMYCIAAPRYVSEFQLTYQTYQSPQKLSSGLISTLIGTSQNDLVDLGLITYQYIQSPTMLKRLDQDLHLRDYFSSSKVDYLSRMNPNASLSTFMLYYNWYVSVSYSLGGYLTVDVEGFDPQFAIRLSQAIVKASDEMLNGISTRARQDQVRYAETELKTEEQKVRAARLALMQFQNAHGDLDPPRSASQLGGTVGNLQSELSAAQAQLADALAYMNPDSLQVTAIKYKIAALQSQLKKQQYMLANANDGTPYSKILEQYASLQLDEEFARNAYQAAQQGVEVARAEAARQQTYMVDYAKPYLPDHASWAIPMLYTLTVFFGSLVLFGIVSLIAAAFRDHAGI